jgi:hypothetical protein
VAVWEKLAQLYCRVRGEIIPSIGQKVSSKVVLIKKICKISVYIFLGIFLFNLFFIYVREKFGLQGCVLCVEEVKEIVASKTN